MHTIKYNRYPNNEIRCTHYYSRLCQEKTTPESMESNLPCPGSTASDENLNSPADALPFLDISSDFPKSASENPHKRTKFGARAKNTILRIGGAYDTIDNDPKNYVFLTGTIPGGTHAAFMAMAAQSPYVTETISDWLRQTAPTDLWFYVWELQKRGALHIHYCLHCPDSSIADKILCGWWAKWESIIQKVGNKTATDMWLRKDGTHHKNGHKDLQAYAQKVQKSVAAYMAGYCSGVKDKHSLDIHSPYYPKRWWGCSRKSTKLLKALTEEVVYEHTNYRTARTEIQAHYEQVLHDSPKAHHYSHKVGIGSTVVSYHPEDKGHEIWLQVKKKMYNQSQHPNIASMIHAVEKIVKMSVHYLRASKSSDNRALKLLLVDCEELISAGSLSRFTLHLNNMTLANRLHSELCLRQGGNQHLDEILRLCKLLWKAQELAYPHLVHDKFGWVCNWMDIPDTVDWKQELVYLGTNDGEASDAVEPLVDGYSPHVGSELIQGSLLNQEM